jgi:hypothetical protein
MHARFVRVVLVAAATTLAGVACSDNALGPTASSDLLRARADAGTVTLTNRTARAVDYLLATPRFLELGEPGPCANPDGCTTTVPARAEVRVPYAAVHGYASGEHNAVVVHWYHGTAIPENVRRIELRLP